MGSSSRWLSAGTSAVAESKERSAGQLSGSMHTRAGDQSASPISSAGIQTADSRAQGIAATEGVVKAAGIAEKAQMEVERRVTRARCQYHYCNEAEGAMIHSWLNRARQAAEIAQQFEQAAMESVEVLTSVSLYSAVLARTDGRTSALPVSLEFI